MTSPVGRSNQKTDIALLILRLVTGVAFAFHGWQKVAQMGVQNVSGFFGSAGVPLPGITGPAISWLELIGGVLLIIGLFLRFVPWLFVLDMLGAITFVHGKNGYSMEHMGFEYVLALGAMAAAIALMGGGSFSVDAMRSRG